MSKRIASLLLSVVTVLLAVFFLNNEKVVEACDKAVLMEYRHPGYWEYLRPDKGNIVDVTPEGYKNLLISDIKNQTVNGVTLSVNADCSITLNGKSTSADGFNFVLGNVVLPNGEYFVSDGADEALGVHIYVWANELSNAVAYGSNVGFSIDNSTSSYQCGIHIDSNALLDNVTIYPMISINSGDSYCSYLSTDDCDKALIFEVEKSNVAEDDMVIFENSLRQFGDYDWISVKYPDGTGIQWKNDMKFEGTMDILGRTGALSSLSLTIACL